MSKRYFGWLAIASLSMSCGAASRKLWSNRFRRAPHRRSLSNEYARLAGFIGINASENFFSIVKRGITGVYHSVSEAHLHRYLAEFDFRYNNRSSLA